MKILLRIGGLLRRHLKRGCLAVFLLLALTIVDTQTERIIQGALTRLLKGAQVL
ncbi:MAG TPA: hypothetical protein PKW33_15200 [Anaerolineaceae bacterium]|nr:hypothetical protein [Anaerolineaceae bacterium]HPN52940.1 hypothetical protein [Anaerolineaceae bacterium]